MDFIRSRLTKTQKILQEKGLYDTRMLLLLVVAGIALSVFWNGAKIIQQNYELQQKVAEIQAENEVLELTNRNKELQNEYLKTDEFADITARRVYGRALPGERVYIVPDEVAKSALTASSESDTDQLPENSATEKPKWQQNLEAWYNVYFGN